MNSEEVKEAKTDIQHMGLTDKQDHVQYTVLRRVKIRFW